MTELKVPTLTVALLPLLLSACGPSNLEECRAEAVKMPTDTGVRLAAIDCQKKFGFDPSTATPIR